MRQWTNAACVGVILGGLMGCQEKSLPPGRIPVPPPLRPGDTVTINHDLYKPLPPADDTAYQPPFDDEPLVTQAPPEQVAYVDAYRRVGGPRITLFVNRSLEGALIPTNPGGTVGGVERVFRTNVGATVDERTIRDATDPFGRQTIDRDSHFRADGPGEVRETTEVYLSPGEYDEAQAKRVDYDAVENIMTDWLAAGGKVTLISPTLARQRLTDEQVKELQAGRPKALSEVAKELDADVFIQVQARATRQTPQGLSIRLVAEAMNTRGGESLGRAVVDVPPPLDKRQINEYTRFLSRKLMNGMAGSWDELASQPPRSTGGPATTQVR